MITIILMFIYPGNFEYQYSEPCDVHCRLTEKIKQWTKGIPEGKNEFWLKCNPQISTWTGLLMQDWQCIVMMWLQTSPNLEERPNLIRPKCITECSPKCQCRLSLYGYSECAQWHWSSKLPRSIFARASVDQAASCVLNKTTNTNDSHSQWFPAIITITLNHMITNNQMNLLFKHTVLFAHMTWFTII